MAGKIHITVKEKILIHLLNYSKYSEQFEVPPQTSQEGIAKVIGVRRSHIASSLKDLREKGFVEEKKARVTGEVRRKNAYFLTHEGQGEALRLKENLLEKKIKIKLEDGVEKEIQISELKKHVKEKLGILEILNRLSDEGVFQEEKEEKEEKEIVKSVFCPFCGEENKYPDLRKVEMEGEEEVFMVPCLFCGNEFMAGIDAQGQLVPKGVAPQPAPSEELPVRYFRPVKPFPMAKSFLVSLGLFFMLGSFSMAMLVFLEYIPSAFFVLTILGFIASLILLYLGLMDVKHLDAITRRILILAGAIFISFITLFLGLMIGAEYDREQTWIMASIVFPAFGVFIFGKPLAKSLRSELSLSLGVFLVLFGTFTIAFFELFSWSAWYSPFWVIAGSMMVFTSYEIERLGKTFVIRAVCVGVGAFMAVFCIVLMVSEGSNLWSSKAISTILWLLVGIIMVLLRLQSKKSFERSILALRSALLSGIGVLFVLLGVLLALNDRFMECAIELFIGIPLIWYGLAKIRKFGPLQMGLVTFIIFSEVITVLSLILT